MRRCETCGAVLNAGQLRFCSRRCYGRTNSPLTMSQADAVLTLYGKGWSAHKIAASIWQQYGYKSQDSCRASISRWLRSRGIARTRSEAQKLSFAQGRVVSDKQKQAISRNRKAYFEKLRAERTHCYNGHPVSNMRVWVNKHGVERSQCRACYHERYERRKRGEKPKRKQKPRPVTPLPRIFYDDPRRVQSQPVRDQIARWQRGATDCEERSLEVLAGRLALAHGGNDATWRRRLIAPLMAEDTITFALADAVITAIETGAWYGDLADLYEEAA